MHIERKTSGLVAADFAFGEFSKQLSDFIEHAGIRSGVRARARASNRRLINVNHFIKMFDAFDALMFTGLGASAHQLGCQCVVKYIRHQCRLAASRYARDANQFFKRDLNIDIFKIVGARSQGPQDACRFLHVLWDFDLLAPR